MMKQKDAVFAAYTAGINAGLEHGSKPLFDHVKTEIFHGITAGDISYNKDRSNEKEVRNYAGSVTNNFFKKDERISGAKYVPQTKRGPIVKDERLIELSTNLKALKVHSPENMELIGRVQAAFDARKAEVAASKVSTKVKSEAETMESLAALGLL